MIAINARYDGKVLIPDEPLDLPANRKVHLVVTETPEPKTDATQTPRERTNFAEWIGLGQDTSGQIHDPGADEDALWQKGTLPRPIDSSEG